MAYVACIGVDGKSGVRCERDRGGWRGNNDIGHGRGGERRGTGADETGDEEQGKNFHDCFNPFWT